MREVILNLAVSLDGFIEGPNGEIDWLTPETGSTAEADFETHFDEFLSEIDAIFYGRVSYDLWGEYQPGSDASPAELNVWNGVHSKRKYVFSRSDRQLSPDVTLINSNVADRVREIKRESGKNIWLYGGANLITTFINLNLVDRFLLAVYPVILGQGKPLFSGIEKRLNLSLQNVTRHSGVLMIEYVVRH